MTFSYKQTVQLAAIILLALVATQAVYTGLYIAKINAPRQLIWGFEGFAFTILIAFAGAAMVQTKYHQLGWSAIAGSAVLNVIQVSIGVTLFAPFREVASELETVKPLAGAILAFSFMVYYAAKVLLGMAAVAFGMAKLNSGAKALGGATVFIGAVAILANTVLIIAGRGGFLPSPVAGGTGVLATLLLALCLLSISKEEN